MFYLPYYYNYATEQMSIDFEFTNGFWLIEGIIVILIIISLLIYFCYEGYKQHMYRRKIHRRYFELQQREFIFSGVYIEQRQPLFCSDCLWFLRWLMPLHISLAFVDPNTKKIRCVGLSNVTFEYTTCCNRTTQFKIQEGEDYAENKEYVDIIPVECCPEYFDLTGHFIEKINIRKLYYLTLTREEINTKIENTTDEHIKEILEKKKENLYTIQFLSSITLPNNQSVRATCQTTVWNVLMQVDQEMSTDTNEQDQDEQDEINAIDDLYLFSDTS